MPSKYTEEQRLKYIQRICKAIQEGATLLSACTAVGICEDTFRKWRKENDKIEAAYRASMDEWRQLKRESLRFKAYSALEKVVEGYEVEEVEEEFEVTADGVEKIVKKKVKKKTILPNVSAIIFAMSNLDENFSRTDRPSEDKQGTSAAAVNTNERKRILDEKLKEIAERHPNIKKDNE
jgi:hypothetical protein